MMNEKDFDIDFDFEKEYGFNPPEEKEAKEDTSIEDEFDLRSILNSDYGAESEQSDDLDLDSLLADIPVRETPVAPEEEPHAEEPQMDEPVDQIPQSEMPAEEPQPVQEQEEVPVRRERAPRRKPRSKMRRFKDDVLPLIIAALTAVLILIFVVGSIRRAVVNNKDKENDRINASESIQNEEERLAKEAEELLDEAARLAAGYDYQAAIDKLDSFTGDTNKFTDFITRRSEYAQAQSTLIDHNDPGAIANLSFQVLIADPARAFTNKAYGKQYNMNFVTTDEFQLILEQLYAKNYVLVNMDSFIDEVVNADGSITYASKPLSLPDGKNPIMITETMVNYFNYMIDGNDDKIPDKDGAGFASRLVVDSNGKVKAEMVDSNGATVVGDYDLVPILDNFIEEHPDFSYRGSRATLAVTGHEGIFGYRTNDAATKANGDAYHDEQVNGAKKVVAALREEGYEIACFTYGNVSYGKLNATEIKEDIDQWIKEVVPILGTVDTIVYARSSDIASAGAYSGSKYNVLKDAGFRYFIGSGNKPSCDVTSEYVRQNRVMVSGTQMAYSPSTYSAYFDSKSVLNSLRGNIPQ